MSPERQVTPRAFQGVHLPAGVLDDRPARKHALAAVPRARFARPLDAGCSTEVYRFAQAQRAGRVVALDLRGGFRRAARARPGAPRMSLRATARSSVTAVLNSGRDEDMLSCPVRPTR